MYRIVSVIGPSEPSTREYGIAYEIGKYLASKGFVVATGGKAGIMEAALKGAKEAGGTTVGILPEADNTFANSFVDIPVATGLQEIRNFALVNTGMVVVSIGISPGTLIEIAYALKVGKPLFAYNLPEISGLFENGRVIRFRNLKEFVEEFENFLEV